MNLNIYFMLNGNKVQNFYKSTIVQALRMPKPNINSARKQRNYFRAGKILVRGETLITVAQQNYVRYWNRRQHNIAMLRIKQKDPRPKVPTNNKISVIFLIAFLAFITVFRFLIYVFVSYMFK